MKHSYERLDAFLERLEKDVYPEREGTLHEDLSREMVDRFFDKCSLPENSRILDVGCGQGISLELFLDRGFDPLAITLGYEDRAECMKKGFTKVFGMDQSFMDFNEKEFDLIWCRHCLEHSFAPLFTLSEFHRALRPNGYLYVEVPAPDTACHHERNPNHYSVFGLSAWLRLFTKSGFNIVVYRSISFETEAGPDIYWSFIMAKMDKSNGH